MNICGRILLSVALIGFAGSVFADDPILTQLEEAVVGFEDASKASRSLVLKAFDSALARAQASGDLATLKAIQNERNAFTTSGILPTSISTRTFERRMAIARRQLESAYEAAIRDYTRNGNVESAELILNEFERFKENGSLTNTAIGLLDDSGLSAWEFNAKATRHWTLRNEILRFDGQGGEDASIATKRSFKNFVFRCDWRIGPGADSGIYIRGKPQVQIWDHTSGKGSGIGSGGLYNNRQFSKTPTEIADKPLGQWNSMAVTVVGDKVTVVLNGKRVVDSVTMENYPTYQSPLPSEGPILLQAYNSPIEFRRITVLELP
jgi:hypothetical protein